MCLPVIVFYVFSPSLHVSLSARVSVMLRRSVMHLLTVSWHSISSMSCVIYQVVKRI